MKKRIAVLLAMFLVVAPLLISAEFQDNSDDCSFWCHVEKFFSSGENLAGQVYHEIL